MELRLLELEGGALLFEVGASFAQQQQVAWTAGGEKAVGNQHGKDPGQH
ncbi:MAG TPA: hypothetical protein VMT64_13145 [Candidatus Binataceae bacterium]|nr:hypothetical protein [Candidatus Binataceae bacterium]